MIERIKEEISQLSSEARKCQDSDGAWRLCADNGPMTDAYFITLCRALGLSTYEDLVPRLATRLLNLQNIQGTWSAYPDEPDINLSTTLEASYALLCSGLAVPNGDCIAHVKSVLKTQARDRFLTMSTRAFFSGIGQLPWPNYHFPASILLTPKWSPIHFNRFVGYARAHIAPVLMASLQNTNITASTPQSLPRLADLAPDIRERQAKTLKNCRVFGNSISKANILNHLEGYMIANIEKDGTLYSYATSTIFMVIALIGRGYLPGDPLITKAMDGIASLAHHEGHFSHIQNADATVWNTGLMCYALQSTEIQDNANAISQSIDYLISRQHLSTPDSNDLERLTAPAGWGFSDKNTLVPDVDDTCATLRALHRRQPHDWNIPEAKAFAKGLNWVWSMQNRDGGWPAFEKNVNHPLFSNIRVDDVKGVLTDPSSADLTGRTLEFLGNYCNVTLKHPRIKKAVRWLLRNQHANGSWRGRWGICFVYGTWAAITGLSAVGFSPNHPALQRAVNWLLSIQQTDGGFGESCQSDIQRKYVPLHHSTISQTAWGLDALIALFDEPIIPIRKAADYLLKHVHERKKKWATYPTGAGLPGSFYIQYESYNYIWPLLALSHYKQKYGT